jgi:hypothetical protein
MNAPIFRTRVEFAPGAVHVPEWLSVDRQREIVEARRKWAIGPVPMRAAKLPGGHKMSVQTVCLGAAAYNWGTDSAKPFGKFLRLSEQGAESMPAVPLSIIDPGFEQFAELLPHRT